MSREKECKCCHEWWYASVIKEDLCPNCYDYFKQLKRQIAEKEKELAYMIKQAKKFNNEAQKYYEDAYCNSFQNQKAIAELEKVKDYICDCTYIKEPDYTNVRRKIDNQIKLLKGEKEVED